MGIYSECCINTKQKKYIKKSYDLMVPPLRSEPTPKIRWLAFDETLKFDKYAKITMNKPKRMNNALKELAGSNSGKEIEVILTSYMRHPVLNYAAPIWSPQLANIRLV